MLNLHINYCILFKALEKDAYYQKVKIKNVKNC